MAYYNGKEWVSSFTPYTPPAPKTTIKSDPEVLATQKMLKAAGYDPGPLDGINGPLTQAALNKYNASQTTLVKRNTPNLDDGINYDVSTLTKGTGLYGTPIVGESASTGNNNQIAGTGTGTGLTQADLDAEYGKMYGDLTQYYNALAAETDPDYNENLVQLTPEELDEEIL